MTNDITPVSESVGRILTVATELFANYGYDGVSTRQIAQAAGLNVATVNYHVGSKRDLYQAVFRRSFQREQELIAASLNTIDDSVVHDATALRNALADLVDGLVNMTLAHPEIPRLWMRRWLENPADLELIESELSLPLYEMVRSLVERARAAGTVRRNGPRLRLFLTSFSWMLYSYVVRGPIEWDGRMADPTEPDQMAAFKSFLHDYLCRMLELPAVV